MRLNLNRIPLAAFLPARMSAAALAESKAEARREMRRQLALLDGRERARRSAAIARRLGRLLAASAAEALAAYWPRPTEPDTRHLLIFLSMARRSLLLPRVAAAGRPLAWHKMSPSSFQLKPGYRGLAEPRFDSASIAAADIPLMLVPSISVARSGERLGSGRGFYDITSAAMRSTILIAPLFSCQLVDAVPWEEHDCRMDVMVTEDEVLDLRPRA